jgi:uncharacterized repeat protein (TIGR01451 family)
MVGPAQVPLGQPLAYEIIVRNTGPQVVSGVRIEQPLGDGMRLLRTDPPAVMQGDHLAWGLGNVEAGGERHLKVEIQARGPGDVMLCPTVTYTAAVGLRSRVVQPPFAITVTGPQTAAPGSPVLFQIQLANHSTLPIRQIVIRDQLPPGLRHPQGSLIEADVGALAPGEVRTIRLETLAVQSGRLVNAVSARAEGGWQAESSTVVEVSEPALTLQLQGPRQAQSIQDLDFLLTVANPGQNPSEGLRLMQVLPEGLAFISASSGGAFNQARNGIEWALSPLPGGQSQTVTFRVRPRMPGDWALQAVAMAARNTGAKAIHAIHVDGVAALSLEVIAHDDPIQVGAETVYEMRVLNRGAAAGSNVRLLIQAPEGLDPIAAEGPANGVIRQQQVTFDALSQLPPRVDAVYKVRVRGSRPSQGRFQVQMTADALARPILEELSTHVRGEQETARSGP